MDFISTASSKLHLSDHISIISLGYFPFQNSRCAGSDLKYLNNLHGWSEDKELQTACGLQFIPLIQQALQMFRVLTLENKGVTLL